MKRLLIGALALVAMPALTGCSPEQVAAWVEWNNTDPVAAQAFLDTPEVQALVYEDWDQDGVVEPEVAVATVQAERVSPPEPAPAPAPTNSVWDRLAECESGGNWSINTGNGYYGGLQFSLTSWRVVGGTGYPHQNSREEQINRGERLKDIQGWGAWPGCARKLGLR